MQNQNIALITVLQDRMALILRSSCWKRDMRYMAL